MSELIDSQMRLRAFLALGAVIAARDRLSGVERKARLSMIAAVGCAGCPDERAGPDAAWVLLQVDGLDHHQPFR
jgi:hypothetical protein